MARLADDERLERVPGAIVLSADRFVIVRRYDATSVIEGVAIKLLREVLAAVDRQLRVGEIRRDLGKRFDPRTVDDVLGALMGHVLQRVTEHGTETTKVERARVVVIGNGRLAEAITRDLDRTGLTTPELVWIPDLAHAVGDAFVEKARTRTLTTLEDHIARAPARARTIALPEQARSAIAGAALLIVALEGLLNRASLLAGRAALEANVPAIFVDVENDVVRISPLQIRGRTACFACTRARPLTGDLDPIEVLELLPSGILRGSADAAASAVVAEVSALVAPRDSIDRLRIATETLEVGDSGVRSRVEAHRNPTCTVCADYAPTAGSLDRRSLFASVVSLDRAVSRSRGASLRSAKPYRTVGILGGGTAGYLTALMLRARLPELDITLIESSKIPILGVGEATTPLLVEVMHHKDALARDVLDFYRRVKPTWKLGISFYWGLPGEYRFEFPFQFGSVTEPMRYQGNIDGYCLGALLQSKDRVPLFDNGDGTYTSYLDQVPFAYHLDNQRFVRYLKEETLASGVKHLDREIKDATLTEDGERIAALVDTENETYSFDLYVDCTGFRSFLIEKKLRSPYVSYASSLFNDSAVMGNVPNNGHVKPYTLAETMDHGWCWNIPFEDGDHRGYVFSSAFASVEEAKAEMLRKNPGMSEPWSLKFRSGRHEHFMKGNVVALGNSYAFVEPLESTAIHMLLYELDLLTKHFPVSMDDEATKHALSKKTNELWDNLRGFLAMHFRFNRKLDTPYWRECRAKAELGTAQDRIALFHERAPLMRSAHLMGGADPFFGERSAAGFFTQEYVYDVLLAGQQVEARWAEPVVSREAFEARAKSMREAVSHALPQAEALALLRERPEILLTTAVRQALLG